MFKIVDCLKLMVYQQWPCMCMMILNCLQCRLNLRWFRYRAIFLPVFSKLSDVSHSDGSCVLGRIHSDVSSNIPKKVYHIVTDNFVNRLHISYARHFSIKCLGGIFYTSSFNLHINRHILMTNFDFIFDTIHVPYINRSSISDEIMIMIRHYVIHPHLIICHYVIHPTKCLMLSRQSLPHLEY